jgi:hypothetical protein
MQWLLRRQRPLVAAAAATLLISPPGWAAEPSVPSTPSLWGYTGLLTVPTAEILGNNSYHLGLRYYPLNSGLSGAAYVNLFDNLEAGLVFGAPPANGFSALSASLKYRVMAQSATNPISIALGASMLGLSSPNSYVPGNQAFLTLSRSFNLGDMPLLSIHGGFMGGFSGSRLVAGLEVPVLQYGSVKLEYLGSVDALAQQALNLGLHIQPIPNLNVDISLMQRPLGTFWDRDLILGIGWRGNFMDLGLVSQPTPGPSATSPSTAPTPQPSATPSPVARPPLTGQGMGELRLRVVDKVAMKPIETATVQLLQPDGTVLLRGRTLADGEVLFPEVPSGEYVLEVSREGWNRESRRIVVQANLPTTLEIPLGMKVGRLAGRVVGPAGLPMPPADIQIDLRRGELLVARVSPDSTGLYEVPNLEPGDYTLAVTRGETLILQRNVTIPSGETLSNDITVTGVDTTPVPSSAPSAVATPIPAASPTPSEPAPSNAPSGEVAARVEGLVRDSAGTALSSVRLKLESQDLMIMTLSTPDGRYSFRDIPRGTYRLSLSKKGFKPRAFQITIRQSETLSHDFELAPE